MSTFSQPLPDATEPMKLAILSSRFWPCSGSDDLALSDLAQALTGQGHEVEVITPGWSTSSPASFRFRNFNVLRTYRSPSTPWGGSRYQKNLIRYLNQNPVDSLIFFNAFSEFTSLAKLFSGKTMLVVRLHDHALLPLFGQTEAKKNRQANLLKLADRVLVESESTFQMLEASGLPAHKLEIVCEGILPPEPPPVELSSQTVARQAIGESHGMLGVNPNQPLLVCGAQMNGDSGVLDLIQAWEIVLSQLPTAKLWVVSQGTQSKKVWDAIVSKQMIDSVVMPGQFDSLDDVFRAADAYLHPLRGSAPCSMLTRAMMAGLCPIVTEPIAASLDLTDGLNVNIAMPNNAQSLADAIVKTIQDPTRRTQIGLAATDWALDRFHISQTVNHYLADLSPDKSTSSESHSGN